MFTYLCLPDDFIVLTTPNKKAGLNVRKRHSLFCLTSPMPDNRTPIPPAFTIVTFTVGTPIHHAKLRTAYTKSLVRTPLMNLWRELNRTGARKRYGESMRTAHLIRNFKLSHPSHPNQGGRVQYPGKTSDLHACRTRHPQASVELGSHSISS